MGHPRDSMQNPAAYEIRVRGHVNDHWVDRLGGLAVTRWTAEDGSLVSVLRGTLSDQSALGGVLNTLQLLQMPVMSVECLD